MPCTSQTDSLIPCISGEIFFFFVPQVQLWSQMMGSEITWCLSLQGELCRKLLVLRDPSSYQRKRSSRDRSFIYLCCCSRREREATVKECVAQSLVSPGCGMLANTTGFSLKKNEPVSHCCVMTSQTNRHPLWITHLCLKLGQARIQLWGWLCPHHLLCWRWKEAYGQLSCFHGDLSRSYFLVLHFFDCSIWIRSCRSACVPVIERTVK